MKWALTALLPAVAVGSAAGPPKDCGSSINHANLALDAFKSAVDCRKDAVVQDLQEVPDPLVTASDPRPCFDNFLSGLRHLLIELEPILDHEKDKSFLSAVGELDMELSSLVQAGRTAPFYFWHGPKRHVPAKLDYILSLKLSSGKTARQEVQKRAGGKASWCPDITDVVTPSESRGEDIGGWVVSSADSAHACPLPQEGWDVMNVIVSGIPQGSDAACAREYTAPVDYFVHLSAADLKTIATDGKSDMDAYLNEMAGRLPGSLTISDVHLALPLSFFLESPKKILKEAFINAKSVGLADRASTKQWKKIFDRKKVDFVPAFNLVQGNPLTPISNKVASFLQERHVRIIGYGTPEADVFTGGLPQSAFNMTGMAHPQAFLSQWFLNRYPGSIYVLPHQKYKGPLARLWDEAYTSMPANALEISNAGKILDSIVSLTAPQSLDGGLNVLPAESDAFNLKTLVDKVHKASLASLDENDQQTQVESTLGATIWSEVEEDKQKFDDNFYYIYKDNIFSEEMHQKIKDEMKHLWASDELHTNCNLDGVDRLGGYVLDPSQEKNNDADLIERESSLYKLIYENEELREWVSKVNGHQMFPSDFPIELRRYGENSKGMRCHRDLLMYKNATLDLEFVYTIDNFSKDCISSFTDRAGVEHKIFSKPNSLAMFEKKSRIHRADSL